MKVLIAYDGSSCAIDAVRSLKRAGLPESAEATVMTVAEKWQAPVGASGQPLNVSSLSDDKTALHEAEEGKKHLQKEFPEWKINVQGDAGSASHKMVEYADEWGADLIVVGSHGLNAVERFVFGSISQQLVTSAHCSVRVARGNPHRTEPVRLLIAIDGSEDSRRAIDTVVDRGWGENTKVWLVTAISSHFEESANNREKEEFEELHEKVGAQLKEKGLHVTSVIDNVDPKYLVRETASEDDVDSIVVGARGLTKFERTLLGSVSSSIAARSECSVEVVRHPKD